MHALRTTVHTQELFREHFVEASARDVERVSLDDGTHEEQGGQAVEQRKVEKREVQESSKSRHRDYDDNGYESFVRALRELPNVSEKAEMTMLGSRWGKG